MFHAVNLNPHNKMTNNTFTYIHTQWWELYNCRLRCSEHLKKWKIVLTHPDSHGGGHFQPLEKNGIEIRGRFLFLFSRAKNLGGPLGPKKKCRQIWVYCIQNDRLGHTVSTKQTVNWSEFVGLRYPTKRAWISLTKPNRQISARFVWYLSPMNSD